jgi:glycosyltransferase involved in cell wall biosynthesis
MSNVRCGQSLDSDGPAMKKRDEVMGAKVSIVIPVYNGANYLAEAIESALEQTHTNFEVVVVNDGSTDDGATRRVAQRYAGRIRYFEKPNGGVASALNFGIAEMTGEYFSWLSHDDLYLPDKIASQLDFLANAVSDRALIVYGNCAVFTGDPAQAKAVDVPDASLKYFRYLLATSSAVHGCTLLIPKSAFDNGGFDVSKPTTQDYDMWFRLAGALDFVKLDRTLVLARQHPEQDSVKKRKKVRAEKNAIYCSFLAELGPEDVNPASRLSPARAYMQLAMDYAKHGLVGATLAAAGKSMSCLSFRKGADALATVLGLALICTVGISWGLARARVADAVRGAKTAA